LGISLGAYFHGSAHNARSEIVMKHPLFGKIVWSGDRWKGRVRIPFFCDFDTIASAELAEECGEFDTNESSVDRHKQGDFKLWIETPDGEKASPSSAQEHAFVQFQGDQPSICAMVLGAIHDLYQSDCAFWRTGDNPFSRIAVPPIDSPDGLKRLIRLSGFHLLHQSREGCALVGFSFNCSWDIEHGLGVVVHGTRLIQIADNAITWDGPYKNW
jgi:hypothetical protein